MTGVCLSHSSPININKHGWTPMKVSAHLNDDQKNWIAKYTSVTAKGLNTSYTPCLFCNKSAKVSTSLCFSDNTGCCVCMDEGKNELILAALRLKSDTFKGV